jgi:hypothetical protein
MDHAKRTISVRYDGQNAVPPLVVGTLDTKRQDLENLAALVKELGAEPVTMDARGWA